MITRQGESAKPVAPPDGVARGMPGTGIEPDPDIASGGSISGMMKRGAQPVGMT